MYTFPCLSTKLQGFSQVVVASFFPSDPQPRPIARIAGCEAMTTVNSAKESSTRQL